MLKEAHVPLVDIQLIKGIFTPDPKKLMIQKVTDAMVSVGNGRQSADHRS